MPHMLIATLCWTVSDSCRGTAAVPGWRRCAAQRPALKGDGVEGWSSAIDAAADLAHAERRSGETQGRELASDGFINRFIARAALVEFPMSLSDVLVDAAPQAIDDLRDRSLRLGGTQPEQSLQPFARQLQRMSHLLTVTECPRLVTSIARNRANRQFLWLIPKRPTDHWF